MRRLFASFALLAILAALVFGSVGCSHKLTGTPLGDKAPNTLLFVQGPVDTVNHLVHMYWYGTDADGYVTGYQIKLVNPEDTVAADSAWHFTARTDTILSVFTPAGHASPVMYARAIDNLGELDPTPAVETFNFRNKAPFVTWKVLPNHGDHTDTTFASVSVAWTCSDPDGNPALIHYRLWLDGNEATPDIVPGNLTFTVPTSRFLVSGVWTAGPRTLYLQAIDDGGMAGNIISTTWYVRKPVDNPDYTPGHRPGKLLIIDEVVNVVGGIDNNFNYIDTLYTHTASRNLPDGTWSVMRLENQKPKSTEDMAQTMKLFDAVVWYHGNQDSVSTTIMNMEPGIRSYLDSGGNIYLESYYLVQGNQASGALSEDFLKTYLDCYGLFSYQASAAGDSSQAWALSTTTRLTSNLYADSLFLSGSQRNSVRVFNVKHASDVAFTTVRDTKLRAGGTGGLAPASPDTLPGPPLPIGISVVTPAGGRAIVVTAPIAHANPKTGDNHTARVMAKIFAQLGLIGP